ncbi:YfhO family protein [Listeria sp. PSOL-1]|uniref:YfhO family protein n=1 Tax=Listeria sp. PSOL-1 TaxID=1844999 RepID=UPI0013D2D504|nr:YfhO family protein [Listeria sp. PSOL-1]
MNKIILYGGSFFVPLFLLCITFASLGVTPFGDNNLLISDIGTQYLQFMYSFRSFFSDGMSLYSFSNGIGDSIATMWSYYLMSPFNFISFLFPKENLPTALIWIIMVKISLMGLSMCYYLKKHNQKIRFSMLLFSTAYSFCGFVVAYSFNYMWLDALILFPLVVLGLERLAEEKSGILYGVTLFLTIVTNFYLGYMVCLFSLVYRAYLDWLKYPKLKDWKVKALFHRWKKFLFYLIFTGILTAFVLLPALFGMLKTAKTSFSLSTLSFYPKFLFSIFSQWDVGTIRFSNRLAHLPVIYSGVLVVLFLILFFFVKNIPTREKKGALFLLFVCLLSLMIELFNTFWHMLQAPAGFPYRNSFILSFLVISFGYRGFSAWQNEQNLTWRNKQLFKATGLLLGLLLLGSLSARVESYIFKNSDIFDGSKLKYLGITLIYLCIYSIFLFIWANKKSRLSLFFIAFLFFTELGLNFRVGMDNISYSNEQTFENSYKKMNHLVAELKDNSKLVRINERIPGDDLGYKVPYYNYNDGYMFDFPGASAYTSTLNKDILNTLSNLGAYSKNERRFSVVESNPALNLLLNIKYDIYSEKTSEKNPEAIGAGLFVRDQRVKLQDDAIIMNLENVLQDISASRKPYFKPAQSVMKQGASKITVQTTTTGNLLMYWPHMNWSGITDILVNGKLHKPNREIETNQLFNLGYFHKGETVTLEIKGLKEKKVTNEIFYSLDQAQFGSLIKEAKKTSIQLEKTKDSHLIGKIKPVSNKRTIFLSIPYDNAWNVKVDGKETAIKKIYGDFIAVEIPANARNISLTYHSFAVIYGILISIGTIMVGLVIRLLVRRKVNG